NRPGGCATARCRPKAPRRRPATARRWRRRVASSPGSARSPPAPAWSGGPASPPSGRCRRRPSPARTRRRGRTAAKQATRGESTWTSPCTARKCRPCRAHTANRRLRKKRSPARGRASCLAELHPFLLGVQLGAAVGLALAPREALAQVLERTALAVAVRAGQAASVDAIAGQVVVHG